MQDPNGKPDQSNTISLWFAYPDDLLDPEFARECLSMLDAEERARLDSFRFAEHQREYLAAHALVRRDLSSRCTKAPSQWRFKKNAFGKPSPDPPCGVNFNLSHCVSIAVCATSQTGEIGLDVEPFQRAHSILEIAEDVFSTSELDQFRSIDESDRPGRALDLWTLKEAYVKAKGKGLSIPLQSFSILFNDENGIILESDPDSGEDSSLWKFCLIEHDRHRIAIVVEEGCTAPVALMEMRPGTAPTRQFGQEQPIWFPMRQGQH